MTRSIACLLSVPLFVALTHGAARGQAVPAKPVAASAGATAAEQSATPTSAPDAVPPPPPPAVAQRAPPLIVLRADILAELRAQEHARAQIGLGLPIALMVVGAGTVGLGLTLIVVGTFGNYCLDLESCDGSEGDPWITTGAILGAAGGIVAVVGLVQLLGRIGERRAIGRNIKVLRRELDALYAFTLTPQRAELKLRLAF